MIRRYVVKGHSMEPSFVDGDRLLLNTFLFHLKEGDVIVFSDGKRDCLKRVKAVNGSKLIAAGDKAGHGSEYEIGRNDVIGKAIMKY